MHKVLRDTLYTRDRAFDTIKKVTAKVLQLHQLKANNLLLGTKSSAGEMAVKDRPKSNTNYSGVWQAIQLYQEFKATVQRMSSCADASDT